MLDFIKGLFNDHKTNPSSKRFIAIISSLCLCGGMLYYNTTELVTAVTVLATGALGISAIDRFTDKDDKNKKDEEK